MNRDDHRATLERVTRELNQLLDDCAGQIDYAAVFYRVLLIDARGNVTAASAQLERMQ